MEQNTLNQLVQSLLASREKEKDHLRGLTTRLLYECTETERKQVIDFFVQAYQGLVRGAYMRGDQMYLVMKEEQRPCEVVAVGSVPEKYKGKIHFSVVLPSVCNY